MPWQPTAMPNRLLTTTRLLRPTIMPPKAIMAQEGDHGGGHHPPVWVLLSPFFATLIGFLGAIWFYLINEGMGARIAARGGPLHSFLYNKWYVDEIYHFVFVRGAKGLGDLFWKVGDVRIIDGFGPNVCGRFDPGGGPSASPRPSPVISITTHSSC